MKFTIGRTSTGQFIRELKEFDTLEQLATFVDKCGYDVIIETNIYTLEIAREQALGLQKCGGCVKLPEGIENARYNLLICDDGYEE